MQQQKNLLLFLFVTFALFMGWQALVNQIWPPPKRPPLEKPIVLPSDRMWSSLPGHAQGVIEQASVGVPGLGNACQLAAQTAIAEWSAGQREHWVRPEPTPPPPPEPTPPPAPVETITLGDSERFNLQVVLTSKGGGVQSVVLNQFEQANRLGLPAGESLHLVPADEREASFLLYHYGEAKASNPLATLGHRSWKTVSAGADGRPIVAHEGLDNEEHRIAFESVVPGQDVKITKTYSLRRGDYHVGLEVKFERRGTSAEPVPFRYQLAGAHGLPIEGEWYTYIFRNALIGQIDAKGNVWRDMQDSRTIGVGEGGHDVARDKDRYLGYAGIVTQYFASMIVVDNKQADGVDMNFLAWARPTLEESEARVKRLRDTDKNPALLDITARVVSEPIDLRPGKPVVHRYLLYNGPVKVRLLGQLAGAKQVADELVHRYEDTLHLNTLTDYQTPNWFGTFASSIGMTRLIILFTNLMHGLLQILHHVVPIYGLCIILLTVIVRGSMFPLSRKQAIASAKMQEKMQEMAPEVKKLEEKFKNDPLAFQQARNELYMKKGINPLAMMGSCWMIFLQMPIFMGLYYSLQESIHFRLAKFLWMPNLAAPDMLYEWGEKVPLLSAYLGPFLNILPIVAVVLMMVHQKMVMPPATDEQQRMQQSMTKWMMIVMGFMFYKMPAGMCIYFIASSIWGLAERKLLPKKESGTAGELSRKVPPKPRPGNGEGGSEGPMQKVRDWWTELLNQASKHPKKREKERKK